MSILDLGSSVKSTAMAGMQKAARLGMEREAAGEQLKATKQATKSSMTGTGMAAGAMIAGLAATGPVGWGALAAGAVIGGAAGFFGADLF